LLLSRTPSMLYCKVALSWSQIVRFVVSKRASPSKTIRIGAQDVGRILRFATTLRERDPISEQRRARMGRRAGVLALFDVDGTLTYPRKVTYRHSIGFAVGENFGEFCRCIGQDQIDPDTI